MPECDINRVNAELDIVEANAKGRYFVKPGESSIFYMKRVKNMAFRTRAKSLFCFNGSLFIVES